MDYTTFKKQPYWFIVGVLARIESEGKAINISNKKNGNK